MTEKLILFKLGVYSAVRINYNLHAISFIKEINEESARNRPNIPTSLSVLYGVIHFTPQWHNATCWTKSERREEK